MTIRRPESLQQQFNRIQRGALVTGIVGLILCAVGAFLNLDQFFQSYLFAFIFWAGMALGGLAIVMVYHLTGGGWGAVVRRLLEVSAVMIVLMAVLFVPLLFGLNELYEWARPEAVAADEILQSKALYLNVPFWILRTVIYFAAWIGVALILFRWSREQDRTGEPALSNRMRRFSSFGVVLFALTVTFASVDWIMSLEPHWFSTIFGMLIAAGQVVAALAFATLVLAMLLDWEPVSEVVTEGHLNDLGSLLLSAVLVWIYLVFSQFMIIWSGNIPEEVSWYVHRLETSWGWVGQFLVLFHFALPFLVLMSRRVKRRPQYLAVVAGTIIFAHLVDAFWLVAPTFHKEGFHIHWLDIAAPIAIGGIWIAGFLWQLQDTPLLPLHDPELKEVHAHG